MNSTIAKESEFANMRIVFEADWNYGSELLQKTKNLNGERW